MTSPCHNCLTALVTRQQAVESAVQAGNPNRVRDAIREMRQELDRAIVRMMTGERDDGTQA